MKFQHLINMRQTYWEHFRNACYYSFCSLRASFYFFIHGIYPDVFEMNGSEEIKSLNIVIQQKYDKILSEDTINE